MSNGAVERTAFASREEWLIARGNTIGGSDAACIIGANPWRTNRELWEIMKGNTQAEDISTKAAVAYGIKAEEHLRELFALDYPKIKVEYTENNLWVNKAVPFAHASLDGWLTDQNGRFGVLEIKTTTIQNQAQKAHWQGRIPQNYYAQILHYFLVTGFDFAILKAQIKYEMPETEPLLVTKHYRIERADVLPDIEYLREAEAAFYESLKTDTPPAIILPDI